METINGIAAPLYLPASSGSTLFFFGTMTAAGFCAIFFHTAERAGVCWRMDAGLGGTGGACRRLPKIACVFSRQALAMANSPSVLTSLTDEHAWRLACFFRQLTGVGDLDVVELAEGGLEGLQVQLVGALLKWNQRQFVQAGEERACL